VLIEILETFKLTRRVICFSGNELLVRFLFRSENGVQRHGSYLFPTLGGEVVRRTTFLPIFSNKAEIVVVCTTKKLYFSILSCFWAKELYVLQQSPRNRRFTHLMLYKVQLCESWSKPEVLRVCNLLWLIDKYAQRTLSSISLEHFAYVLCSAAVLCRSALPQCSAAML
jgi:hypothetical protein